MNTAKPAKVKVSTKPGKSTVACSGSSKKKQSAPKHSKAAVKAHPAPEREEYDSSEEYAAACRMVDEARAAFDKPKPVGRPTSYKPEYAEQAYKLCLLGSTDKEMADFFGVSEQTLNAWKPEFPEFLESITRGKTIADAQVAESLYKRATGYTGRKVITANVAGVISDIKEVNDYVGPDTQAASLWLRNRQSAKWRDKVDHELTGKDGGPMQIERIERVIIDPK